MKAYVVHYMNKFPGAKVIGNDSCVDVHLKDGSHAVAVRKNGAGQWVDHSEELGCSHRHDLSPIPKDSRVFKLSKDGKIEQDELAEERSKKREDYMDKKEVYVKSCEELKKEGFDFDERQVLRGKSEVKKSSKKSGDEANV